MKRKTSLSERKLARALQQRAHWGVLPLACLATLLGLPVNAAVTIPGDPLASGVRVAPNILFVLDDSGSMAWDYMPDNVPPTSTPNVSLHAYTRNSLSYNPAASYEPWMNADGNRLTGGTSYTSAYSATQAVPYTGVKDDDTTGVITTSGTINLAGQVRTFYVPKDTNDKTAAYLGNGANYYRYQITPNGKIYRSEWKTSGATTSPSISNNLGTFNGTWAGNYSGTWNFLAPAYAYGLTISTSGGSVSPVTDRGVDLYILQNNSAVDTANYTAAGTNADNTESITRGVSGSEITWYVRLYSNTAFSGTVTAAYTFDLCKTTGSDLAWRDCTEMTTLPGTGRTIAQELVHYATWYSYFRTRNKVAKAGAAEAFSATSLGNKVRVGFTTIWNANPFYIPVGDGNDGRFVNNDGTNGNSATKSRAKWYSHLFQAGVNGTTPLRPALNRAGSYFSNTLSGYTDANGPYGPETGSAVLSCRQNFTILTTDGYWNESGNPGNPNYDGANFPATITGPGGKTFTFPTSDPYPQKYDDSYADTLADVAMRYWNRDLMPGLTNNVPSGVEDPAFWQHMVTFGIAIGLATTTGWSSVSDVPGDPAWPQVFNNHPTGIDDLLHAAVNGHGEFIPATDPTMFANGLAAALAKISERTASFSNVGATSSTELTANAKIFSASYVSGRWSGMLRAESAISPYGELWKTTNTGTFASHGSRNIITRGGTLTGGVGGTGTGGGASFPTAQQTAALVRTGGPANYAVTGADNAAYIRGDQSKEDPAPGKLRKRTTLLGDIVNSSPAYVTDTNTVYVGSNDGMLHAFRADTGVELFAYIPGIINFGNLGDLSRGDYEHRWFVDGPIAISSRELSPDGTKNILVGTLGRGGKGVYALDVTNPATFGSTNVKWERNASPSNHMGMVLGAPILAKVRNGTPSPAVVLGNGINSGSDTAALIVLNMDDGSVIREIQTDASITNNGLFAPTGVYAADGVTLVYVYAGDLQGNVWKFDLRSATPGAWSAKKIFAAGPTQPITSGIATALDPRTGKTWILFGTGSFMTAADGNDMTPNKNSMYGVIDDITTGSAYTRSDLTVRTVTADGAGERYFQDLTNLTNKGWYVDLPDKGERIVQNAQIDGSYMITASMMPSGDSCSDASGGGYINAITPFPDMTSMNGRSYFDLDGDGNTDDTGTSGKPTGSFKTNGIPTLPLLLPGQGRYGIADGVGRYNKGRPQWNRVSWRELRKD